MQQSIEEEFEGELDELSEEEESEYFFMEHYSEESIKSILTNFIHEAKSIDGLWVEKTLLQRQIHRSQNKSGGD